MAKQARNQNGKAAKRPSLKYFFLNGMLHKKLVINRGADTVVCWNYPEERRMKYTYSDVLRRKEPAFTTTQVCKMVNRQRLTLEVAMRRGMIERPQHTYGLDENKRLRQYMWSEKDIMDLHAYLSTVHRGRPRKDGLITPQHLPTPGELRAMIRQEGETLGVMRDGVFVPTWRAKNI